MNIRRYFKAKKSITHNLLIIIIIGVLLLFSIFSIQKNIQSSSLRIDKRDFSFEDTLKIDKIILSNRNLESITLERNETLTHWVLNEQNTANSYSVNLLLKTIKEMRIKQPISRISLDNIIKRMAIQNTKVEIFIKNKIIKTIFVGGETQDQLGTYMMLKGATEPYIMHIPGFNGYLSSRFSCKEVFWRSKQIFKNHYDLQITLHKNSDSTNNLCISTDLKTTNIYCESFITDHDHFKTTEILSRNHFISINYKNNPDSIFIGYRKNPVNKDKYKHHKYDRERFYGLWFVNNKPEQLMLIQYNQFNKLISTHCSNSKLFKPWEHDNN